MKEIDPIDLTKAGFAIAKAKKEKQKEINQMPYTIRKKWLKELRKEAKAIGFKVEGKKGPDGAFHIYLTKGNYRRQAL